MTNLIQHNYFSGYRDIFGARAFRDDIHRRKTWTEWIDLKKDQKYYLQSKYVEGTGSGADSFDFEEEDGFVSGADQAESTESPNTQEQVDVSVNIDAAPAAKEKPKAKPKVKAVPVEEPEDVPSATTNDELAAEIAKLVGE